jgi:hypothetical protein
MPKYPNIIGTGFPGFIQNQINTRSNTIGSTSRDGETLSYLNNRTGWFRMTSAAIVDGSDDLAKNNILQGGIVSKNDNNTINLNSSFNERYTKGNDDDLGLRPMPGITGLSIGTGGKWQTIQESEVSFTCYNLDQLNTMSQLYMSLGVQVFIEYGHLPYYDNSNKLISKVDTINFFNFNKSPIGRETLIKSITKKEEDTHGNYGALMGYVFNFNYTANPDGSYTCSSKVIGPGHLAESLTINNSNGFSITDENTDESKDNRSDLENIFNKLIKFSSKRSDTSGTQSQGEFKQKALYSYAKYSSPTLGLDPKLTRNIDGTYDQILNVIYQNSNNCNSQNKITFSKEKFSISDDNLKFGNATQIINGVSGDNDNFDGLKPIGTDPNTNSNPHFFDLINFKTKNNKTDYSYITLGHLFFLIQNFGILVSEEGNSRETSLKLDFHPDNTIIKTGVVQGTINPFVCAVPLKISPVKGETEGDTWTNFFGGVVVKNDLNEPKRKFMEEAEDVIQNVRTVTDRLGIIGIAAGAAYESIASKAKEYYSKTNLEKNIINTPILNQLNPLIDYIDFNDENNNIKLFNILVNLPMVLDVFEQQANLRDDRKVFLIPFLDKILSKISAALGGINNLRMSVDKNNHILRVVDEHRLKTFNNTEDLITIPIFGKDSIALNYSYSAQITNNLAKQVVIAAQAINNEGQDTNGGLKAFPDEVLSYNYLNGGVTDRFVDIYNTANANKDDQEVDIWRGKYQKLFDHLSEVYRLEFSDKVVQVSLDFTKPYIDRQQIRKNFVPSKAATILMPLALTIRLDGITGIRPYNAFKIPDNRLPIRYRGKIAFIVYSINHVFENNKWFTDLVGQTIYLEEEEKVTDNTIITDTDKNPKKLILPKESETELIEASYPIQTDGFSTSSPKAEGKASPTTEDEQENNNINPPGDGSQNNNQGEIILESNPNFGSPTFSSTGNDVIGATELISSNEVPGGIPLLTAYPDTDYTNKAGFTYRIGFGSDTITSPNGSVRRVQKGDTITTSMASADLNRRITQEFRPKVIQACQNNGVFYPSLPDCVKSVFIDIAYNYGTLWNSIVIAYRDGGKQGLINELKRRAELGPNQVPSRRYEEINYLNTRC